MTEKPLLSTTLRNRLISKYDTLVAAAGHMEIEYARLKKALTSNKFNSGDLTILVRHTELKDLEVFDYTLTRENLKPQIDGVEDEGFGNMYGRIIAAHKEIKVIAKRETVTDSVSLLYGRKWTEQLSMFLFGHLDSTPVEWESTEKALRKKISDNILNEGGLIVYVFHSRFVDGELSDAIDRKFKMFATRLEEDNGVLIEHAKGLVVLLRVPHCGFCTPFQKFTLFIESEEDGSSQLKALSAISVPDTRDGDGATATLMLPQARDVAHAAHHFLDETTRKILKDYDFRVNECRLQSFPPLGVMQSKDEQALEILRRIRAVL